MQRRVSRCLELIQGGAEVVWHVLTDFLATVPSPEASANHPMVPAGVRPSVAATWTIPGSERRMRPAGAHAPSIVSALPSFAPSHPTCPRRCCSVAIVCVLRVLVHGDRGPMWARQVCVTFKALSFPEFPRHGHADGRSRQQMMQADTSGKHALYFGAAKGAIFRCMCEGVPPPPPSASTEGSGALLSAARASGLEGKRAAAQVSKRATQRAGEACPSRGGTGPRLGRGRRRERDQGGRGEGKGRERAERARSMMLLTARLRAHNVQVELDKAEARAAEVRYVSLGWVAAR